MRIQSQELTLASGFTSFTQIPRNKVGRLRRLMINNPTASGDVIIHLRDHYTREQPATASSEIDEEKFTFETNRLLEVQIDEEIKEDIRFIGVPLARSEVSGAVVTLAFDIGDS